MHRFQRQREREKKKFQHHNIGEFKSSWNVSRSEEVEQCFIRNRVKNRPSASLPSNGKRVENPQDLAMQSYVRAGEGNLNCLFCWISLLTSEFKVIVFPKLPEPPQLFPPEKRWATAHSHSRTPVIMCPIQPIRKQLSQVSTAKYIVVMPLGKEHLFSRSSETQLCKRSNGIKEK